VRRNVIGSAKKERKGSSKDRGATKGTDMRWLGRGDTAPRRCCSYHSVFQHCHLKPCVYSCLFGLGEAGCIAPAPERAPARSRANPVPSPTFPRAGPRRPTSGRVATPGGRGAAAFATADTCRASGGGSSQVTAIRQVDYSVDGQPVVVLSVPFRSAETGS
jgi:hypothetical protein